jgi:hypothetical protein
MSNDSVDKFIGNLSMERSHCRNVIEATTIVTHRVDVHSRSFHIFEAYNWGICLRPPKVVSVTRIPSNSFVYLADMHDMDLGE